MEKEKIDRKGGKERTGRVTGRKSARMWRERTREMSDRKEIVEGSRKKMEKKRVGWKCTNLRKKKEQKSKVRVRRDRVKKGKWRKNGERSKIENSGDKESIELEM